MITEHGKEAKLSLEGVSEKQMEEAIQKFVHQSWNANGL